jgi:ATP-dependent exoDNAse (exonuclease V) alpha subunit
MAEQRGYELVGLAPSHSAVKALDGAGIEARTLQSWLSEKDDGKALSEPTILVVDEAGLVGNKNLQSTLERANKHGARVLLVGDTKQYQAVEAGRACQWTSLPKRCRAWTGARLASKRFTYS